MLIEKGLMTEAKWRQLEDEIDLEAALEAIERDDWVEMKARTR